MKRLFFTSFILIFGLLCNAQKIDRENLCIAYYNADKLFDYVDNEGEYDDDFTGSGKKFWGEKRYNDKLDRLAEVIGTIQGKDLPGIIVISEVENLQLIRDLLQRKIFRRSKYNINFIKHPLGKSTALLSLVELSDKKTISLKVETPGPEQNAAISYTTFTLADGKKYHLFINNWVDRTSGLSGSEPARMNCAVTVRKEIDNILNFERDARIIVMGTFYDEPTNKSILTMLNASNKKRNINYRDIYNPFYDAHNQQGDGTVLINGNMQMYDFILVSPQLLRETEAYSCKFSSGEIAKGESTEPISTFRGDEYTGGASSHFPVFIRFSRPLKK